MIAHSQYSHLTKDFLLLYQSRPRQRWMLWQCGQNRTCKTMHRPCCISILDIMISNILQYGSRFVPLAHSGFYKLSILIHKNCCPILIISRNEPRKASPHRASHKIDPAKSATPAFGRLRHLEMNSFPNIKTPQCTFFNKIVHYEIIDSTSMVPIIWPKHRVLASGQLPRSRKSSLGNLWKC